MWLQRMALARSHCTASDSADARAANLGRNSLRGSVSLLRSWSTQDAGVDREPYIYTEAFTRIDDCK